MTFPAYRPGPSVKAVLARDKNPDMTLARYQESCIRHWTLTGRARSGQPGPIT